MEICMEIKKGARLCEGSDCFIAGNITKCGRATITARHGAAAAVRRRAQLCLVYCRLRPGDLCGNSCNSVFVQLLCRGREARGICLSSLANIEDSWWYNL
ncbi:hypothetical protein J6590_022339 [Homalodisca vitripennis]|nr:hypothetical protein J6590_022339 [Homalodisca vitripennis]